MKNLKVIILVLVVVSVSLSVSLADLRVSTPLIMAKSKVESSSMPTDPDYPPTTVDMKIKRVSEHVYYVQGKAGIATDYQGFISNAGVIITEQGIVLFDCLGTPSLGKQLLQKIRTISNKPIVKVVVSHYHADHMYGLQVFKDLGAEVIAPRGAEQYLQSNFSQNRLAERKKSLSPWVNNHTRLITPDVYIDHETQFKVGDVSFKLTPEGKSHSHGDMIMQVTPDNVLFVGDLVFEQRIPFVVTGDSKQWLHTLQSMSLQDVKVIVPGHGAASRHPASALSATRGYLEFLRGTMKKAVDEMIPFDEAYNVDWSRYQKLPAFDGANRKNAYSVYLSLEADSITEQ